MKRILVKYKLLVFTVLSVLVVTACGGDDLQSEMNKNKITVEVKTVQDENQTSMIEFSGVVEGAKKAKLSTKLMGNITYFPLEAGAKIKKGDVLVKIQSKDIEAKKQQVLANLSAAEAAHFNMKRNYDRVKSLYEKESATEKEFEDVTLGLKMTEAQVKAAKEMKKEINDVLSYSSLRAPFDGYIVNKFVQVGDIAAPGYPLLIVENFDNFEVTANVSAEYINKMKKGNQVKVVFDVIENRKFDGKILEANPGAHPASRQYSVKIKINSDEEAKKLIKSGMYARVLVPQNEKAKILLDENLLVRRGQLTGVYTVNRNNEATLRWLRLGKKFGEKYEVLSGLKVGEKIIKTSNVEEGQRVEVK